jgi:hypothetical protein
MQESLKHRPVRRGTLLTHFIFTLSLLLVSAATPLASRAEPPATSAPAAKTLIDYFQPTPIVGKLSKDVWGAPGVLPRDPLNGLEDPTIQKFDYWDGQIIPSPDGKFHLFASRWDHANGHGGWGHSVAIEADSDNVIGPYVDKGMCWPNKRDGKGHNVTALVMPDGRYAVIASEIIPAEVYASQSPDGPWQSLGLITVKDQPKWHGSNVTPMLRPDGQYMIVQRSGEIMLAKEIIGPYVIQGPSIYKTVKGLPLKSLEDPTAWYSGGLYHMVVNSWSMRKAFHLTSEDGVTNWTFRGLAYDPTTDFIRYTDGTVNHWEKLERPSVLLQNGHVTHFTFAAIDIPKEQNKGDDHHGSKVIVVPFDGAAMDRDLAEVIKQEKAAK